MGASTEGPSRHVLLHPRYDCFGHHLSSPGDRRSLRDSISTKRAAASCGEACGGGFGACEWVCWECWHCWQSWECVRAAGARLAHHAARGWDEPYQGGHPLALPGRDNGDACAPGQLDKLPGQLDKRPGQCKWSGQGCSKAGKASDTLDGSSGGSSSSSKIERRRRREWRRREGRGRTRRGCSVWTEHGRERIRRRRRR